LPVALTAASAGIFGLAFPVVSWRPLAWVALVPFFIALRGRGLRSALALGALWGVLASYCVGVWFAESVSTYFLQPMPIAIALFVGVATTMAAPYFMGFAAAHRLLVRSDPRFIPLLVAAAWVAAELLRGRLFTGTPFFIGNPWALIGYSQMGWLPLVQIASVTGVYGVSFAVACVNAALAELWHAARRREEGRLPAAATGAVLAMLPAALIAGNGFFTLARADRAPPGAEATRVAAVQGNINVGSQWRSDLYGKNLDIYLRLSLEALRDGSPEILFWPEAALTFFVEDEPLYRRSIASVLRPFGAELVVGGPRAVEDEGTKYYNSVWRISPEGEILGRYDKEYLVPLAEYFPLGRIDVLRRSFSRIRVFEHGRVTAPVETRAGPAGVVICNEAMLPEVVADRVSEGAVYLVNPSNDTWINHPQYQEQQFAIAAMRAIEQRRYLLRISTAGPSAVIDPWGRVKAKAEHLTRDVIVSTIEPRTQRSIYNRVGDLFAVTCAIVTAVALLWARRRRVSR
jgi:apolipoprotein N-acyltransferase